MQGKYFYSFSANVYRFLMFRATPDTLKYIHGIDEQVGTEDYFKAVRFYYHLIRQSMVTWSAKASRFGNIQSRSIKH